MQVLNFSKHCLTCAEQNLLSKGLKLYQVVSRTMPETKEILTNLHKKGNDLWNTGITYNMTKYAKKLFTTTPMVAYSKQKNIGDLIIRYKLKPNEVQIDKYII